MSETQPQEEKNTFTGIKRSRKTSKQVILIDFIARGLVTLGGIGTIISVATVCLFLLLVVVPLFQSSKISDLDKVSPEWHESRTVSLATDEYRLIGWTLGENGRLNAFKLKTGEILYSIDLFDKKPTAISYHQQTGTLVGGFEDGMVQYVTLEFKPRTVNPWEFSIATMKLAAGTSPEAAQSLAEQLVSSARSVIAQLDEPVFESITSTVTDSTVEVAVNLIENGPTKQYTQQWQAAVSAIEKMTSAGELSFTSNAFPSQLEAMKKGTSATYLSMSLSAEEDADDPTSMMKHMSVAYATPEGQRMIQLLHLDRQKPKRVSQQAIARITHGFNGKMPYILAASEEAQKPKFHLVFSNVRTNFITGVEELKFSRAFPLELEASIPKAIPDHLVALDAPNSSGRQLLIIWKNGVALRIATPSFIEKKAALAETVNLLENASGATITSIALAQGQKTMLVGRTDGVIDRWHLAEPPTEDLNAIDHNSKRYVVKTDSAAHREFLDTGVLSNSVTRKNGYLGLIDIVSDSDQVIDQYLNVIGLDNQKLFMVGSFNALDQPISSIASSYRSRIIAAGSKEGSIALYYIPTGELRTVNTTQALSNMHALAICPKNDGLIATNDAGLFNWSLETKYPEASPAAIFKKVVFENYHEPQNLYQATGSEGSESKLSIMPLIFGTLKATFYTMIFAVPIALLAAIYTSEFLSASWRSRIKPVVEAMASLPSVILGFFAGLVFAQIVERELIGYLSCFITLPLTAAFAGQLWQCLPHHLATRFAGYRMLFMFMILPLGMLLGFSVLGPILEHTFYDGDLISYLNGYNLIPHSGSSLGGWLIIYLPISYVFCALITHYLSDGFFRGLLEGKSRLAVGLLDLVRFIVWLVLGGLIAYLLSFITSHFFDTREKTSIQFPVRAFFITPILVLTVYQSIKPLMARAQNTLLRTLAWLLLVITTFFLSDFIYYGAREFLDPGATFQISYAIVLCIGVIFWVYSRAFAYQQNRPEKLGTATAVAVIVLLFMNFGLKPLSAVFAFLYLPIDLKLLNTSTIDLNWITLLSYLFVCLIGIRISMGSGDADWRNRKVVFQEIVKGLGFAICTVLCINIFHNGVDVIVDPTNEGAVFDTYIQRNALVVGFFMSFAVIPIIYTIAEDALSSVPAHLRAASLGAGATPWQTAVRIIIPTAASGLFSACMVGLGRAVGETMIVLMATGNTSIMEWSVFNGLRTLAANIAYEMPEAAKGESHFRTLFLQALVLFAMTFVINTLAEYVRQKVRKRNMSL